MTSHARAELERLLKAMLVTLPRMKPGDKMLAEVRMDRCGVITASKPYLQQTIEWPDERTEPCGQSAGG